MITLKDIADKLGVSIATVSNAINGKGNVSTDTRNKVLTLATEYGYQIDRNQSEDEVKNVKNIGVIFPEILKGNNEYTNYFVSDVLIGVEKEVRQKGYNLLLSGIGRGVDVDSIPMLKKGDVEALLIVGGVFEDRFMASIKENYDIPVVIVGTFSSEISIDAILADNRMGGYQATKHLIELGHSKIGLINSPSTTKTSAGKKDGYRDALQTYDLPYRPELICEGDFSVESGYHLAFQLLQQEGPTALFVGDDLMAIGAMNAINSLGMRVPDDVAVIGFGNSPPSLYTLPSLTTINIFKEKMGRLATNRLFEQLDEGGDETNLRILLSTQLVTRDSCGSEMKKAGRV